MSLSVGIVGLPNAGKSTLFNILCSRKLAETDARPFTTIDPHEAVVPVPDRFLESLFNLIKPEEMVPASVTFIDIAGLVKGAHKGEGLGNQFLAKIREVDVLIHVVRAFTNANVSHQASDFQPGSEKQIKEDIEIVDLELELGGVEKKPIIYVLNIDEGRIGKRAIEKLSERISRKYKGEAVIISAKIEEEVIELSEGERGSFLEAYGIEKSGLEQLIKKTYRLLNLITFYTIKGGKEVHAWSIKTGANILEAAAKVHTDFARKFIKAEVIEVEKLLKIGGWKQTKEKGQLRLEGKEYRVEDGDVIEFIISK